MSYPVLTRSTLADPNRAGPGGSVLRHPLLFSTAVYLSLWALAIACGIGLPGLSIEQRAEVFQALAALLATVLLTLLGWWGQVGLQRPRNLRLFALPVLALIGAPLLGGVELPNSARLARLAIGVLVTAWSEEVVFRGILWRALLASGLWRTVLLSAVLFGSLHLAGLAIGRSMDDVTSTWLAIFRPGARAAARSSAARRASGVLTRQ